MSEQMAEQTSDQHGSLSAGPAVANPSEARSEPVATSAHEAIQQTVPQSMGVESPKLVPDQGGAVEIPELDAPKVDAQKSDAPKLDAPKVDAPKADAPGTPGKIMIMSPDERAGAAPESEPNAGMFGKRRIAALAAVVALAAVAGALGGALATTGIGHSPGDDTTTSANRAFDATVARIDAEILALKANLEHTSKANMTQFNKTSDRLDKVEKAQAEPAAKLAKLSEAVDRLRVAPVASAAAAVAPAAAKDVTGSISPAAATAPAAAPKAEMARLPTVEGWVLRDVANGGALIEGRRGMFEVYAGDPIPGLGRVDAIRRQDGRWVVVTGKGLIVAR
jgi:hypothetical protein